MRIIPSHTRFLAWPALAACAAFALSTASAQSPAVVAFDPVATAIDEGNETAVNVTIEGASDLFGMDIELSYDPEVVEIVDADPETAGIQVELGTLLEPDFVVENSVDEEAGLIRVALTQVAPSPAVSGDGTLLSVTLRGISDGDPALAVKGVLLARADGSAHPVTIGGEEPPPPGTPVPTPTPATPTATLTASTTSTEGPSQTATTAVPTATGADDSGTTGASPVGSTQPQSEAESDAPLWPWIVGGVLAVGVTGALVGLWKTRKPKN